MSAEQHSPNEDKDRKSLDDRAKMTELERIRHSCAHVLATAILRLWPDAQFAYGPPVENGFYYDLECSHRISPEDFEQIEVEMKKEIKANNSFEKLTVTRDQAIADAQAGRLGGLAERPGNASKFKLDLLKQIPEGEPISYFRNGDFIHLCAGPHVMRTGNIGAFKLTSVAAAYYKGDEKAAAPAHLRDGVQEQDRPGRVFQDARGGQAPRSSQDRRGNGPVRHRHGICRARSGSLAAQGHVLVEELEKLAKETEFAAGYVRVKTPHLAKEKMYKTSGHLPYYAESMFPAIKVMEEEDKKRHEILAALLGKKHGEWTKACEEFPGTKETFALGAEVAKISGDCENVGTRYYLKAMNCPHHHRIFAAEPELPGFAIAPGGIRRLLPLRAIRRTLRPHARALAEHERCAHLLYARTVRRRSSTR